MLSETLKMLSVGAVLWLLGSINGQAAPLFVPGALNQLSISSYQNNVDVDHSGTLSPGDLIYGILNVTKTESGGKPLWDANNVSGPGVDSFSGYYLAKITSFTPLASPYAGVVTLGSAVVDPNGIFSTAELASGMFAKLFTDSVTPFESNGSISDDITKATDGVSWGSLSLMNGYWSVALMANGVAFGGGGANFALNGSGFNWGAISDPGCSTCLPVQFYFGTVANDAGTGGAWRYIGANTATVSPESTVSEPASVMLMVVGLIVLFGRVHGRAPRRKISPNIFA